MTKHLYLVLFLSCTLFSTLFANGDPADAFRLNVRRAEGVVKLDGFLDEPSWNKDNPAASRFKLNFPNDTAFSKWQTEVYATFDDNFLYFGAVCYQKRSDYTIQSLRRDFGPGTTDVLNILLGPAKDGLNGMAFGISPYNVQREALIDNGANLSFEWDNKWYSAVQNYDDRWVVEIAIPFKTLRYTVAEGENSWELQFVRAKVKEFETSSWRPVPFQFSPLNLAFAGRLIWETPPPKPGANISIIPYAIGNASLDYKRSPGDLSLEEVSRDVSGNMGADAKVAITSGLNLDLTLNPDFSQVEVDRQVPNLSRFELFFPEVRQFFLENRDLFSMFGFPGTRPFFSRRIGVGYNPVKGLNERIPIVGGARLSGKLTDNLRVGLLNMQTRQKTWSDNAAVPASNFTVATVQQKVFGRSAVSAILVNRQNGLDKLNETQKADWQPWNRVAGLEYNLFSKDNRWEGEWYYHRSFSPDPKKRGGTLASFLGYEDRYFSARFGYQRIDSTYDAEAGFVPRPGVQSLFPGFGVNFYPKGGRASRHITQFYFNVDGDVVLGLNGFQTDHSVWAYGGARFRDQSYWNVGGYSEFVYLFEPFDPTNLYKPGTLPLPVGAYPTHGLGTEYSSGTSTDLQGNFSIQAGQFFSGSVFALDGQLSYRRQPIGLLTLSVNYNRIRLPEPYASADIWLIGPRFEVSFRKDLFLSGFFQYNTQSNNFNINTRVQWRFAPASDVFLVYTDNSFAQSVTDSAVRFLSPKNKAIVLKFVYWLNL